MMTEPGRITSYALMGLLLALTGALILEGLFTLPLFLTWLVTINLIAFLFYWIDKANAEWADGNPLREALQVRIPEVSLLFLALAGGSPLALVAMMMFEHKVSQPWFIVRFITIVLLQGVLLILFWSEIPWPPGFPLG
jgi:uncharacterized membrane protein YsdA (DUF1294 family)